mmetsp:Transcript_19700/g.29229  ORF Transcript_19700/g.29229 Transcript_19700/m.29229 type:complete len:418 (-) Transcript_19700:39-1292(-)
MQPKIIQSSTLILLYLAADTCHALLFPKPPKLPSQFQILRQSNVDIINGNSSTKKEDLTITDDIKEKVGPSSDTFISEDGMQCVLSDDEGKINGEIVNNASSQPSSSSPKKELSYKEQITVWIDGNILLFPIIIPVFAYISYENIATTSALLMDVLNEKKNWVSVDGGAYEAKIITPAINGVVISSIAILFGTLISETITTLRQRQQDIRTAIHQEAGELRVLQAMVDSFPNQNHQQRARSYLIQYCSRLISECQPGVQEHNEKMVDSEMSGFLYQLNEMNAHCPQTSDALLAECYMAVSRLNSERSQRISSIQSTFPKLHFAILTVLALTICFAYLLETNQDINIFLNAVKLRLLWAMLVGVFSALAVVCYDLGDPFSGNYQITSSVSQLYTLRNALQSTAKLLEKPKSTEEECRF